MVLSIINRLIFIILFSPLALGQTVQQEKMKNLRFMIGDWQGTSKFYENGKITKEISAFENISYRIDNHIITIDLKSESLQLHTVIYYDEKENVYYYNPFYKKGAAKYKAKLIGNKFIVNPTNTKRFVFTLDDKGNFTEYGEELVNGQWIKYFEDIFSKIE